MWFLVRMALWLGAVVLLLPAAPPQKTIPQVGATKTVSAAKETVHATRAQSRDTLTPADLTVSWRGPQPRREAGGRVQR